MESNFSEEIIDYLEKYREKWIKFQNLVLELEKAKHPDDAVRIAGCERAVKEQIDWISRASLEQICRVEMRNRIADVEIEMEELEEELETLL